MTSNDSLDFPPELCTKPSALIGLYGLNVQNNPLHRAIWEAFSKSHDRSSVSFKLLSSNHVFPPVKPKKTTYDWYVPKGILKRNWMRKHLLEIPAVVALLFDLNWDDSNEEQLRLACVTNLQAIRASIGSHTTKLVVILIQKVAPLPEDTKASEKARALCAACEIETKQLFLLPHGDHLQGYIIRLENALYDLAQNYYHQEIKLIKQHKDLLNKNTQQYLFVRHHFKLGFLSELKQDNLNAKKYYDMAYVYIKEVRITDTNIAEVKLIAGFISYKLCCLMFRLNQPRDAITLFKLHIEYYKAKTGPKDLIFEHYSWLSKQYSAFADVFNDAVRQGLAAVQTQHPGFYYRLAARYAIDRKNASLELCKDVTTYPSSDPLKGLNTLEFYGQRPWRPGKLSIESINPAIESEGTIGLKYMENLVNHSNIIISLLGSAISQFKTYRCPRMRLQLVVQMADEYFYSRDYGKALTLFSHILWDYKDEKWWLLLSTLLTRALSCAYLAASVQDYIIFSIEALGPLAKFDLEKKKRIFSNLIAVLQLKHPKPEFEMPEQALIQAQTLWESTISAEQPQLITVEMSNIKSCIEAKARFVRHVFNVDENVSVEVYIRSSCPFPVELSQLSVVISGLNHSSEFTVSSENESLNFEPNVVKKILCEFKIDSSDIGKTIQISSVLLTLALSKMRTVVLKYFITSESNETTLEKPRDEFQFFRLKGSSSVFDKMEDLDTAKIVSAESKIKIQIKHDSPALVSEWYPIEVIMTNDENGEIVESNLDVKLQPTSELANVEQTTQLCTDVKNCIPQSSLNLPIKDISQSDTHSLFIYLRGHRTGERNLVIKLSYCLAKENGPPTKSFIETLVKVPIVQPFEVSSQILSMKFESIENCFARNHFILSPTIRILSPWPILIHQSTIEPSLFVKSCDLKIVSHLAGTVLNEHEVGTDMFPLVIEESSDQPIALGTYIIKWSRANSTEVTSSSITMPTVLCEPTIVGVEMNLPAHGWVRKPMKVEYSLCNHTNDLLQLDLFMEPSDAFMFAGQKQVLLRLLPGSVKTLKYNLYPLFSGLVALPRLVFKSANEEFMEQLNQMIDRNLSSHVYVMPQEKLRVQPANSTE